jgi:hypothetical protein
MGGPPVATGVPGVPGLALVDRPMRSSVRRTTRRVEASRHSKRQQRPAQRVVRRTLDRMLPKTTNTKPGTPVATGPPPMDEPDATDVREPIQVQDIAAALRTMQATLSIYDARLGQNIQKKLQSGCVSRTVMLRTWPALLCVLLSAFLLAIFKLLFLDNKLRLHQNNTFSREDEDSFFKRRLSPLESSSVSNQSLSKQGIPYTGHRVIKQVPYNGTMKSNKTLDAFRQFRPFNKTTDEQTRGWDNEASKKQFPNSINCSNLEATCRNDVPLFVTFAFSHVGRWSITNMLNGIRYMYSSLVKSHRCKVVLFVYTNDPNIFKDQLQTTTMKTKANIVVRAQLLKDIPQYQNFYPNPWIRLSRFKLDVVASMLKKNEHIVWIDIDTLVFIDLTSAFLNASSWVIGWQSGRGGLRGSYEAGGGGYRGPHENHSKTWAKISDVPIPPQFDAHGDLWAVDLEIVHEILRLERTLSKKPDYDIQGYFSVLLTQGSSKLKLLQSILPMYSFGFQCANYAHFLVPNKIQVKDNKIHCSGEPGLGVSSNVGVISFTTPAFVDSMLGRTIFPNQNSMVRSWIHDFFHKCD